MKQHVANRTLMCATYIVRHQCTLRQAAAHFSVGKSTVHTDMMRHLPRLDRPLYLAVLQVLADNKQCRHLRGGQSTKQKYLALHEQAISQSTSGDTASANAPHDKD